MSTARHTLRPATLADVEPVAALLREVNFKARSEAGWRWLFQDNPAHRRQDPPPEMGWVLERDGAIDGYLGNVHVEYVLDGRPLRAATCTSYYVRPGARTESVRLMQAFFKQPEVALYLTTTANAPSEPIYRLFKLAVPEDPSFSEVFVWIAGDRLALRDALVRKGISPTVAGGLAIAGTPAVWVHRRLTGFARAPEDPGEDTVLALSPHELDGRFDRLWALLATAPGLRVKRDAATLRWYFSDPDAGGVPAIFAVTDAEGVVGYAAAARHWPAGAETAQVRILDLIVRPGGERAVLPLLQRVLVYAREAGVGFVYCAPCGTSLAGQLKELRPYAHGDAQPAYFLRAANSAQTASLTRPGVWQATGLDGDSPFCIENVAKAR